MKKSQMFQILFDTVASFIIMTEKDKSLCLKYFEPKQFPKNTILEDENKIPQYQYFVCSGIMRNHFYNDLGESITTDLNSSPRFFTSYNNFINRNISHEIIECVTNCNLLRIKRDHIEMMAIESDTLKDFTIRYLEKVFEEERARIKELTTLSAEQRYRNLLNNAPNIILHVPSQHIASYLGIKAETLSRIRRRLIS